MKQETSILTVFAKDTINGLSAPVKYLKSKYLYDDRGSSIFSNIMQIPEYYLTDCEMEIFRVQKDIIARYIIDSGRQLDIIELGSGDGLKTEMLLKTLKLFDSSFRFIPVDISSHANNVLADNLRKSVPGINVQPQTGDYFRVMRSLKRREDAKRVVLFLGSNIGNFSDHELDSFLSGIKEITVQGDQALIGFDLKKSAEIIIRAYNDPQNLTREFNLNHLVRINRELDADFETGRFDHIQEYNPETGDMKSYLVSLAEQEVNIASTGDNIQFARGERIFMELSRKFDSKQVNELASAYGFNVVKNFTDSRNYFIDSLWVKD